MCDEFTAIEEEAALAAKGLSRREFAAAGAVIAVSACTASPATAPNAASLSAYLEESMVAITTPDGTMDAFFVHPARGRHPAVILWPDVAGLRDAYLTMARRLAMSGFAVIAVNQYYRGQAAPIVTAMAEWRTPEGQAKLRPLIAQLNPDATVRDARAIVGWLDTQRPVDTAKGIGSCGYCQGGSSTVRTAWAAPNRVKAAASFHGGGLVTDQPNSPHRLLAETRASYLIAIAQNDDARAPTDKDTFRAAAEAAGRPAEIEVYPADHGWCTIDAPVHNQAEADRAWARMLVLFGQL